MILLPLHNNVSKKLWRIQHLSQRRILLACYFVFKRKLDIFNLSRKYNLVTAEFHLQVWLWNWWLPNSKTTASRILQKKWGQINWCWVIDSLCLFGQQSFPLSRKNGLMFFFTRLCKKPETFIKIWECQLLFQDFYSFFKTV